MDKQKFLSAYENATKTSASESFQYTPTQILHLSIPSVLGASVIGITNTRKFRMFAHTREDMKKKTAYVNITQGLGRRIFLAGAIGLTFLYTSLTYDAELMIQRKNSVRQIMLAQGFDTESKEGRVLVRKYDWEKMKEGLSLKKKNKLDESSVQIEGMKNDGIKSEDTNVNIANQGKSTQAASSNLITPSANNPEPQHKLTNLKNPRNWKHWTDIESDKSDSKSK